VHQQNFPSQSGNKLVERARERENPKKEPLKCWGCGKPHMLRDCPKKKHDNRKVYNVHKTTTVNDVSISVPRIYEVVEYRQENQQAYVVELEYIITKQPIYISIDLGSNLGYISPRVVEACLL
jgi:hypothetical protein